MKRSVLIVLAACCLISPLTPAARAGEPSELLQAVPSDAWAMVSVRSLAGLDKSVMNMAQMMNVPPMSPLAMAKGMLGLLAGVDDKGGVALVIMPAETPDAIQNNMALLIPTTDYTELLSLLEPEDVGDGLSKIMLFGRESYVAQKGNFAVTGSTPEVVKAVLASQKGVATRMTAHQIERWGSDDVTIWLNLEAVTASPLFAMVSGMAQMIGVDLQFLTEFKSVQITLRLGAEGIDVGLYTDGKAGSDMAKALASVKPASQPLLTGLPAESLIAAFGQVGSKENSALGAQFVDKMFDKMPVAETAQETLGKVREAVRNMVSELRSVSIGINGVPEEGQGMFTVTALVGVEGGAAGFLANVGEVLAAAPGLMPEEEAADLASFAVYKAKAEGENVDHLVLNPAAMGVGEDKVAMMKTVLGPDGLLIRLSAVDATHVAITLGGGSKQMELVASLWSANKAPVSERAAIKAAAASLPPARTMEGYVMADAVVNLVARIAKVYGEEIELTLPPIEAPVTMFQYLTEGRGLQFDLLIPMELLKAAGQAAMSGAGGGPPQGQDPTPSEPSPEGTGDAPTSDGDI